MQSSSPASPWQPDFDRRRKAIRDFTAASDAATNHLKAMRDDSTDPDKAARCSQSIERVEKLKPYFKNQRAKTRCDPNRALTDDQKARLNRFVKWLEEKLVVLETLGRYDDGDREREGGDVESDYEMDVDLDSDAMTVEEEGNDLVVLDKKTGKSDK
jgi:hypothetical protein